MIVPDEYASDAIQPSVVYSEMYTEMRRYRDYEFSSSTWYTALLLGILGFLIATRFGDTTPKFGQLLTHSCWLKLLIILAAVLIGSASSWLIQFSYGRYRYLRNWTDQYLEPSWKMKSFKIDESRFNPRRIYHFTVWLLVVSISAITILPA